jgi:hypothetical protein
MTDPENHEDAGICMPLMKSLLKADQLDKGIDDEDPGICADCGYPLTLVRPGKAQCDYCELLAVYEQESYDHQKTREALNALIEQNDKLQEVISSQRQLLCEHGLAEYGN